MNESTEKLVVDVDTGFVEDVTLTYYNSTPRESESAIRERLRRMLERGVLIEPVVPPVVDLEA